MQFMSLQPPGGDQMQWINYTLLNPVYLGIMCGSVRETLKCVYYQLVQAIRLATELGARDSLTL